MEKHAALKRGREEKSDESGRFYEEAESSATKRLRKDINVCEITIKMDNEELCWDVEEIDEEMVWDIMKILDEDQISASPSRTDDKGNTSVNGSDELESTWEYKSCSFNAELDYLFGASDDELGIPCSPCVNDYEYDSDSGFFEWIEVERTERQLLLQMWLEDGSHLF